MTSAPRLSVILCTHNPRPDFLASTLAALHDQTLPAGDWELLVVDNASEAPLSPASLSAGPDNVRLLAEPRPGLTPARLRGIAGARGGVLVFVDDDNVLAPGFLASALDRFATLPRLAAAGGPVHPWFEAPPPAWLAEFHGLLALRDHGDTPLVAPGGQGRPWPDFAPVGAGLCIRREYALAYAAALAHEPERSALDRRGGELTSGGDNDLVFTALDAGGDAGYFPELALTHLIPAGRMNAAYLARLNEGIQRSWVRVLALHGRRPWPAIPRWTVPLRSARAWLRARAWLSPVHHIRWRGLHGRFLGQADVGDPRGRAHA